MISSNLVDGDAMRPSSTDMLFQSVNLPMGKAPKGDGWRIMTGNNHTNLWARIAYRYEADEDSAGD